MTDAKTSSIVAEMVEQCRRVATAGHSGETLNQLTQLGALWEQFQRTTAEPGEGKQERAVHIAGPPCAGSQRCEQCGCVIVHNGLLYFDVFACVAQRNHVMYVTDREPNCDPI